MRHTVPVGLLGQWLYSCIPKGCKLGLGTCFFTIRLNFQLTTGQGLAGSVWVRLSCEGWWELASLLRAIGLVH